MPGLEPFFSLPLCTPPRLSAHFQFLFSGCSTCLRRWLRLRLVLVLYDSQDFVCASPFYVVVVYLPVFSMSCACLFCVSFRFQFLVRSLTYFVFSCHFFIFYFYACTLCAYTTCDIFLYHVFCASHHTRKPQPIWDVLRATVRQASQLTGWLYGWDFSC